MENDGKSFKFVWNSTINIKLEVSWGILNLRAYHGRGGISQVGFSHFYTQTPWRQGFLLKQYEICRYKDEPLY